MWISYLYFSASCICIAAVVAASRNISGSHAARLRKNGIRKENNCWMTLKAKEHFATMQKLEEKYAKARREFNEHHFRERFDEEVLGVGLVFILKDSSFNNLLDNQGVANREVQKVGNQKNLLPSGMNLGGHSMMRMPDSLMFFHRLKLRNDTRFRVNFLSSNFSTMTMKSRVSLNDLHLVGNYERVQTKEDPSLLHYSPSYGEIEVLLRDVKYNMEGRYRLQKDRIYLELVLSELYIPYDGILMLYSNSSNKRQQSLQTKNIAGFLDRLKNDLDLWIKDYFNEFLADYASEAITKTFMQYDQKRIMVLNKYVDKSLKFLKLRLKALKSDVVKLPSFVINAINGIVLQLKHGSLSGLDTMYRRSMATNSVDRDVRKVDVLIAFSSLKARYSYEVKLTTRAPPLFGSLILSGDELSAIMSISMVKQPLFVDLQFDFIQQLKPESLTVEGSVGRIISTFKHMLELHITAIMTNTMIDQVKQLSTLTKCVPTLVSYGNKKESEGQYYKGVDMTDSPDNLHGTAPAYRPGYANYNCPHRQPGGPRGPYDPRWSNDPRRPDDPRGPNDPRWPNDPRRPDDPRGPKDPRLPGDPRRPDDLRGPKDPRLDDDPRRPGDSRRPNDPRLPEDPRRKDDPRGPKDPRWPGDPRLPGDPREAKDPRLPGDPRQPGDPRGPDDKRGPDDPRRPSDPRGPDDPRVAGDPRRPGDPRGHDDPRWPGDPRRPSDPRGPDDPRGPHDPRRPDEPRAPNDPRGPGDPRGPHDARGPNDPRRPGDSRRPDDPRGPNDPVFPGDLHVGNMTRICPVNHTKFKKSKTTTSKARFTRRI